MKIIKIFFCAVSISNLEYQFNRPNIIQFLSYQIKNNSIYYFPLKPFIQIHNKVTISKFIYTQRCLTNLIINNRPKLSSRRFSDHHFFIYQKKYCFKIIVKHIFYISLHDSS